MGQMNHYAWELCWKILILSLATFNTAMTFEFNFYDQRKMTYWRLFIFSFCSLVNKVTDCELESWDSVLSRGSDVSHRQHIQTSPGVYPFSCLMGTTNFILGSRGRSTQLHLVLSANTRPLPLYHTFTHQTAWLPFLKASRWVQLFLNYYYIICVE